MFYDCLDRFLNGNLFGALCVLPPDLKVIFIPYLLSISRADADKDGLFHRRFMAQNPAVYIPDFP
jgi:hypothetical protein